MVDIPDIKIPVMDSELARKLTDMGLYHGTVLYHLNPEEVIDVEQVAEERWKNEAYVSFGGFYVTFNKKEATSYARELGSALELQIPTERLADLSPIVYRIGLEAGCEYALDEDMVGWGTFVEYDHVIISDVLLFVLDKDEQERLAKLEEEFAEVESEEEARKIYEWLSREYAPTVLEAYTTHDYKVMQMGSFRLFNDCWRVLEADEIV